MSINTLHKGDDDDDYNNNNNNNNNNLSLLHSSSTVSQKSTVRTDQAFLIYFSVKNINYSADIIIIIICIKQNCPSARCATAENLVPNDIGISVSILEP